MNSDYFPLLSLNAPRDRFKKMNANDLFRLRLMGIHDSPFRKEHLGHLELNPDANHPFKFQIRLANKIYRLLQEKPLVESIDFKTWGNLQILTQPKRFCASREAEVTWIIGLYNFAILANNFGTQAFRDQLLEYANQFDCRDNLEPKSRALLNATIISLGNFESGSGEALRKSLVEIKDSSVISDYRAFIISCYLSSLIKYPSIISQQDLHTIAMLTNQFDATDHWLAALLAKKLNQNQQRIIN